VFDVFTALLAIGSTCALLGTVCKVLLAPPKVWDEDKFSMEELEAAPDYNELRKKNPHIWID
jgi:hypothetical protein